MPSINRTIYADKLGAQLYRLSTIASQNAPARAKRVIPSRPAPTTLRDELTPRQYELVGLLALGYTFDQIAFRINRAPGPLKHKLSEIYEITGTADRLELATRFAWERKERESE